LFPETVSGNGFGIVSGTVSNISLSDRIARGFFYFLAKTSIFNNYFPAVFVQILPVHRDLTLPSYREKLTCLFSA